MTTVHLSEQTLKTFLWLAQAEKYLLDYAPPGSALTDHAYVALLSYRDLGWSEADAAETVQARRAELNFKEQT